MDEISLEEAIEYLKEIREKSKKDCMIYPSPLLEKSIEKLIKEIYK